MKSEVEIIKADLTDSDFEKKVRELSQGYASLNPPKKLVATSAVGTAVLLFYDYACENCRNAK